MFLSHQDEKNQVMTTNVWLDQIWYDQRLVWSPEDFSGIKKIRIPPDMIWRPDVTVYNSVDDYTSGYMPSLAMVDYTGVSIIFILYRCADLFQDPYLIRC